MKMAEYISREAALKAVCDSCGRMEEYRQANCEYWNHLYGGCAEIDALRALPTADVAEVKHGQWIPGREICCTVLIDGTVVREYEDWHCSECGVVVETWEFPRYKYCPACGGCMDKNSGGKNPEKIWR